MVRVFIQSFGCSLNVADGEVMAGCLSSHGYSVVEDLKMADVVIYNTCAVKTPTENKMISLLRKVPSDKRLIITGCLPMIDFPRLTKDVRFDAAVGPSPGLEIVKVVREVTKGKTLLLLRKDFKPPLNLPRIPRSRLVRILPIAYGCLGECSYCCVRMARGQLRSYPIEDLKGEVERGVREGCKEVWLTAQDTSYYGRDLDTDLPSLLGELVKVRGFFWIRIGMMNPAGALKIIEDLVEAYKHPKVFKFLHLPVQSGDDRVLRDMNRPYTVDDFKKVVAIFREVFPDLTLSTDFICGFPTEDDKAFNKSLELIREIKPDVVNISKFYPRPNTPASTMKQLNGKLIKERSRAMSKLARLTMEERNRTWLGWKGKVLIDEVGKPGTWIGRNYAYKPVVVRLEDNVLGKELTVEVKRIHPTYLEANVAG